MTSYGHIAKRIGYRIQNRPIYGKAGIGPMHADITFEDSRYFASDDGCGIAHARDTQGLSGAVSGPCAAYD